MFRSYGKRQRTTYDIEHPHPHNIIGHYRVRANFNSLFTMGSPIEPGNLVSLGYLNFRKKAWMKIVHISQVETQPIDFLLDYIFHIHTVLGGFAYPSETRYADCA